MRLTYFKGEKTAYEVYHENHHNPGKVEKCDLCAGRLAEGKEPACVVACPAEARIFGDFHEKGSRVNRLVSEKNGVPLNAHLGTEPSIFYV